VPLDAELADALKKAKLVYTKTPQVALFLFMLSHFVADSCMPCHCDHRYLGAYRSGLHKEMEKHWGQSFADYFDEANVLAKNSKAILQEAKEAGEKLGLKWKPRVPSLVSGDLWKEVINLCRASFALNSIIAPPATYPYDDASKTRAPFKTVFDGKTVANTTDEKLKGQPLLDVVDQIVLHDAVLNIAMAWKHVWTQCTKRSKKSSKKVADN
jgi:hypothetical protein